MSIGVAFRAFFAALFDAGTAARIDQAMTDSKGGAAGQLPAPAAAQTPPPSKEPAVATARTAARSEALTLLATLQREARLLDLIQEPLDQFDNAQIGAAAREVLKDARQTLDRLFAIQPLSDVEEGGTLGIDVEHSPNRLRLVGKSNGTAGTVTHRGWKATCCDVPQWNGSRDDTLVLAPTEVEVD